MKNNYIVPEVNILEIAHTCYPICASFNSQYTENMGVDDEETI